MKKRVLSLALAVALVLSMVPAIAQTTDAAMDAHPIIDAVSLTLNGILEVQIKLNTEHSGATVTATLDGETVAVTKQAATDSKGRTVQTVDLVPQKMHKDLVITASSGGTVDSYTFTVKKYCDGLKGYSEYAKNEALVALLDALCVYGDYAAYYTSVSTEAPSNNGVNAVAAENLAQYAANATGNSSVYLGASLYLHSGVTLRAHVKDTGYTLYVDGKEVTLNNGKYELEQVGPSHWGNGHTFALTEGTSSPVRTISNYSIYTYIYNVLKNNQGDAKLQGLLKAMYLYAEAAKGYTGGEVLPDFKVGTGKDSQGNYNSDLFTMNQLTTYIGDPDVIYVSKSEDPTYGGYYYMYGSNSSTFLVNGINDHLDKQWADQGVVSYNAPCFRSKDMVSWEPAGVLGNWFTLLGYGDDWVDWTASSVYAPEVIRGTDGKYYMYYTAAGRTDGDWATKLGWSSAAQSDEVMRHMLGIAVSDTPVGPFTPITKNGQKLPLVDFKAQANLSSEFSILDPNPFVDDNGTLYLYFKEELRAGEDMCIFGMKMTNYTTPDYTTLKALESNTKYNLNGRSGLSALTASTSGSSWNSYSRPDYYEEVIEAPQMIKHDGKYYLTYSRWGASDEEYSIWQSVGSSPLGNFTTETEKPLLSGYHAATSKTGNDAHIIGSAHHAFVTAGEETFILYHVQSGTLETGMGRYGHIDRVNFVDNKIVANGPSEVLGWQAEAISGYANVAGNATISGVTNTNGYLTDSVIPYYSYNSSQVISVTNGNTITLTYDEPVYARAIMVYSSLKKDNAFTSVSMKLITTDDTVHETGTIALTYPTLDGYYDSTGHIPCTPAVAEFSELKVKKIEITVNGSGTMYIPEIVVLGRTDGTDMPGAAVLNQNYADILYGANGKDITIDGTLDETAWSSIQGTTTTFGSGSAIFKTYTDDTGVYFAADVTDSGLTYTGNPVAPWLGDTNVARNSWFDFYFYITQPGASIDYNNCAEVARFGMDLAGNVHANGYRVKKAINWNGSDRAILEAFISWDQLGVEKSADNRIRILPQYWNASGTALILNTPSVAGNNYQDKHAYIEYTDVKNAEHLVDVVENVDGSYSFKAEPINTSESKQLLFDTAGKAVLVEATFVNDGSSEYQGGFVLKDADGNEVIFKMATWNGGAFYVNNSNGYGGYFDINYGIDQILGGSGMLANKEPIQARMLYFNGNIQFYVYHNGAWQAWTKLQSLVSYMNGKDSGTGVAFAFNTSGNVQVGAGFYGDANSSGEIKNLTAEIDSERLSHLAAQSIQHLDGVRLNDDDTMSFTFDNTAPGGLKYVLSPESGYSVVAEATFRYSNWFYHGGFALNDGTNTMYIALRAGTDNIAIGFNNNAWSNYLNNIDPKVNTIWTDSDPSTPDPVIKARLVYENGWAQLYLWNDSTSTWDVWSQPFCVGPRAGLLYSGTENTLDITQPMRVGIAFDGADGGINGGGYVDNFSYEMKELEYIHHNLDTVTENADGSVSVYAANTAPGTLKYLLTTQSGTKIEAEATFRYSDWFYHGGFALNDGTNTMYIALRAGTDNIPLGFNNNVWSNYLDNIDPKVNTIWTDSSPSTPDPVIKARLVYENGWAQLYLWNDSTSAWDVWSQPFHVGTREGTRYAGTVENVLDTTKPMRVGVAFDGADGGINGGGYVDNFRYEFKTAEQDTEGKYTRQNMDIVTENADGSVSVFAANNTPGDIKYLLTKESGYSITAEATFRYRDWFYHGGFALNDGTNTMYIALRAGTDSIAIGFNNNPWSNYLDNIDPKVNTIWTDANPSTPDPVIKARLVYENGWAQLYLWNDSTSTWDVWSQPFCVGPRAGLRYDGTENILDISKPMRVGIAFDGADSGINGGGYVDNFSYEMKELEYIHHNLDTVTVNADGSVSVYAANTAPGTLKYLLTTESGYSITAEATFRYSDWFYQGGFALSDGTNTMYFAFRAGQDSIPIGFNNNVWSNYLDNIDPKVNTIWTDSNPSTPDPVIKARLVYENGWVQLYLWNDSTSTWDVWSQPFHVGTREGTRYAGTVENVLDTTKPMHVGVAFDGADGNINGGGYVDNFSYTIE